MMLKKQRVEFIQKTLNTLFPNPPIPLKHQDPFTLLVAVVLSARSTDVGVNKVTPALFAKASTPTQMAALDVDEIRAIIKPCGLSPQKAKALQELSQILLDRYGGEVPQTFEGLEALPGVGHKTASVVLSQAFEIPAFPVDTHIYRLARRWELSKGKTVEGVERDLKKLFNQENWILLHLQIIYFARQYCPSRGHNPAKCPICRELNL